MLILLYFQIYIIQSLTFINGNQDKLTYYINNFATNMVEICVYEVDEEIHFITNLEVYWLPNNEYTLDYL